VQQPVAVGQSLLAEHFVAHALLPAGSVWQAAPAAQHCDAQAVWPLGHCPLSLPELPLEEPDELPLLDEEPASPSPPPPPVDDDDEHAPTTARAAHKL
jgi:hypothetical protein